LNEESRRPIQLQPDVKHEFDRIHVELGLETQSKTIKRLIDFYREYAHRVQV